MKREFLVIEDPPTAIMKEELDFPLHLVWTARFEPLYLARWWVPDGYTNTIVEHDLWAGGRWRVVQRDPSGNEFSCYGVVEEVVEHSRVTQTFITEIFADVTTRITTEFEAVDGGTIVTSTHTLMSPKVLHGALSMGGLERMAETSDSFERLLVQLSQH